MNKWLVLAIIIIIWGILLLFTGVFWGLDDRYFNSYKPKTCLITLVTPACYKFPCTYDDVEYLFPDGSGGDSENVKDHDEAITDEIPLFVNHTYPCRYNPYPYYDNWYCRGTIIFENTNRKITKRIIIERNIFISCCALSVFTVAVFFIYPYINFAIREWKWKKYVSEQLISENNL